MKRLFYFAWLLCFCKAAAAQPKNAAVSWYGMPQAALLNGDNKVSGAMMLTSGVQCGHWLLGAGAGIDYYKVRSAPLLAEIRYRLLAAPRSPFLYAHAGYNMAWALDFQHHNTSSYGNNNLGSVFNNGWLGEGGIGYDLWNRHNQGLSVSMGYSVKTLQEVYEEYIYNGSGMVRTPRKMDYTFKRFSLALAFRL